MKIIQGFVTKASFVSNEPKTVADFFEISPFGLTYSKYRTEYQHNEYSEDVLHVLKAWDVDKKEYYELTPSQVREILSVCYSVLNYANSYHYPYDRVDFINNVQSRHGGIAGFDIGMIYSGARRSMPEWFSYTSVEHGDVQVKIWLRNEALESQYSDYEIVVVQPIPHLDDFFGNYGEMVGRLNGISLADTMQLCMDAREEIPETYLRIHEFNYVNRNNNSQQNKVRWPVLIYGEMGDNIDAIKDSIVDHILKNSSHSKEEWEKIFPELFMRTEFMVLPRWDLVSIENLTTHSNLYSSMVKPTECLQKAVDFWNLINRSYIENNSYIVPFDYKCVTTIIVNGSSNRPDRRDLKAIFPDYLPQGALISDFNRMKALTRGWVLLMVELLKLAETATMETGMPSHIRKVQRDGKLYLASMYDDINYLVATKSNLI